MFGGRSFLYCLGNIAVWGGLYSFYECSLLSLRQRHDGWNSIASGFLTGASIAVRGYII